MESAQPKEKEQESVWNGASGRAWVDNQEMLDRMFQPVEDLLVREAGESAGRVLDVGCGTGTTTLAIARRTGDGRCTGIDISEPMLTLARARAEREGLPVNFILADAQRHPFEPASFDTIVSRFGVMLFDDPVAAFRNLRHAATVDARLRLIVWRGAEDNPFMTVAERAAAHLLPGLTPRRADAPGQFGFGDAQRVSRILEDSGWNGAAITRLDVECTIPAGALEHYAARLGPVGLMLRQVDEATRAQVVEAVRAAFTPYVQGDEVRYSAACWMISRG
ncbi:MAG: class I SAM-dependent methyltransferase [Candidatus Solibacter sp.]